MDNTIVFVSGFSGYEDGMTCAISKLRLQQGQSINKPGDFKVIDYSNTDELYTHVIDAWHDDYIPIVQTSIESIKGISEPFSNSRITKVLFAPDSSDTYYSELLSKAAFSDDDIDRIIDKAENECDKVWLYDRIITDSKDGFDTSDFFLDNSDTIPASSFDLLDFKESLSSILYKRRYDRLMNNRIIVLQTNTEPG